MYLTANQLSLLGRLMTTLAEPQSEPEIRTRVGQLVLDLLGAQHFASYVWDAERQRFDAGVRINMDAANISRYEDYFQFHDPITFKLQQHRYAVRVTDVMPQAELRQTEFFNDFLAKDGLYWGVNLYAWDGPCNIGDLRIWRDKRRENFSNNDINLLNLVRPALIAALRRCRGELQAPTASSHRVEGSHWSDTSSVLSPRESEVATLVARGMNDKEIARHLGIALTTVRTHIDHAFQKLDVHNRISLVQKLRA